MNNFDCHFVWSLNVFLFIEMHLKISSAKWRPCCRGINMLMVLFLQRMGRAPTSNIFQMFSPRRSEKIPPSIEYISKIWNPWNFFGVLHINGHAFFNDAVCFYWSHFHSLCSGSIRFGWSHLLHLPIFCRVVFQIVYLPLCQWRNPEQYRWVDRSLSTTYRVMDTLQWRNNGRGGISNHHPSDCLLNRLFRRRSKKTFGEFPHK